MKRTYVTAAIVLTLDLIIKYLVSLYLPADGIALEPLVRLTKMHNTGIALGLFSGSPVVSLLLPVAVIIAGFLIFTKMHPGKFACVSFGMILGGFVGNYSERIIFGHVTDMIYLPWMPWFVCNVADIAICFGVAFLAVCLITAKAPESVEE